MDCDDFIKVDDQRGSRETSAGPFRTLQNPFFSHYAALRGNVFWVLLLRRTRHDTPRPWANQQKATFTLHPFSPLFAITVVVLFRDYHWSSGIQGGGSNTPRARRAPVVKKGRDEERKTSPKNTEKKKCLYKPV
ncbi:hypothetical protein BDP55DRAFT_20380 [Colletotrichum godetiae]|uniref:Uncharacterized protein n=1 Tax=Colletotrichum godetiae TaxID=1209918 RepID=A0AAJ0B2T9_9PEZI|nr:uncharacterized protein BDP55DRAFT_20380 [Colletotrichum godetiae]KAK1701425.1 hypothetical protein BDP55DRAFT_20380 [Colletotrichum godetiae]